MHNQTSHTPAVTTSRGTWDDEFEQDRAAWSEDDDQATCVANLYEAAYEGDPDHVVEVVRHDGKPVSVRVL